MALVTAKYLIDKSALARMIHPPVRRRLAPIIEEGEAASCAIVDLEVLFSARTHADYVETRRRRELAYRQVPLTEETFQRAIDVQQELARSGHHRLPIPDLIIAAAAEGASLTVLHYDSDFDIIARVTGQPMEWVVDRGSLP
jgi:predicted nucleic acid-binding protein